MTLFYNTEKLKEEIGIISTCCWCYTGFKTRHGVVGVIQVSRLDMVLLVKSMLCIISCIDTGFSRIHLK